MPANVTSTKLERLVSRLYADQGLANEVSGSTLAAGVAAARKMNDVLGTAIERLEVNSDGVITPDEVKQISRTIRADQTLYAEFLAGHGDDEGSVETGFHKIQNNGGSMLFQGRNFVNTTADAIYHIGLEYKGANFVNEDGDKNERIDDIAGWLNYFINGENRVFGSSGDDQLGSGMYSKALADAANEIFDAGEGNDKIWADKGNDTVLAGSGNDQSGGGSGSDRMFGGTGRDQLWGEAGADRIEGGMGNDELGGGTGNDTMLGGAGKDHIYGDAGDDDMSGGAGDDEIFGGDGNNAMHGDDGADDIHGSSGNDMMAGGDGNDCLMGGGGKDTMNGGSGGDELSGGEGRDKYRGGKGADKLQLWDQGTAADTLCFDLGDSGRSRKTIDIVEGFQSKEDKIDLRGLGTLSFEDLDYAGGGQGSLYYDGHYLRIDADGDAVSDMIIQFKWVEELRADDFILV